MADGGWDIIGPILHDLRKAHRREKRLRVEFGEYLTEAQKDAAYHRASGDTAAPVLGHCSHGVNLDRDFRPKGCRV